MKVHLFYDVYMVPPDLESLPMGHDDRHRPSGDCMTTRVFRFLKVVPMPCLLMPGQVYTAEYDPVTGQRGSNDFVIKSSGVFEDGGRQTPHMIVVDDYFLSFDTWHKHETGEEERRLWYDEQVELWFKTHVDHLRNSISRNFLQDGWKVCGPCHEVDGRLVGRQPGLTMSAEQC